MSDQFRKRARRALAATAVLAVGGLTHVLVTPGLAAAEGSPLLSETFSGPSVSDPAIIPLGTACLTAAVSAPPDDHSRLGPCPRRPVHLDKTPPADVPGYLRLTDNLNAQAGAVLYNHALPANGGISATFDQYQYGGNGADGIAFFLVDGSANLTTVGAAGGSLGYAQSVPGNRPGVHLGYLGVGLDVYGNFEPDTEGKGSGCATKSPRSGTTPNAVGVRGPGDGLQGYCWVADNINLPGPLGGTSSGKDPSPAARTVRVTVTPDQPPKLTVDIDFHDGKGLQSVLATELSTPLPTTFKFGLAASTGGLNNVHLIRNMSVSSVVALPPLNLVKQVSQATPQPASYTVGDTVPYEMIVTNTTGVAITDVAVQDPQLTSVACPATTLAPAGKPGSTMVCTGSHTITAADATATSLTNTATATGMDGEGNPVEASASVTVPITPKADLAIVKATTTQKVTQAGETIPYTFTVTNLGNLPITGVAVNDPVVGEVTCPVAELAPGAQTVCTGSHATTQEELDAGRVGNIADVTGTDPSGGTFTAHSNRVVVPALFDPALSLVKASAVTSFGTVGQQIPYEFYVTNIGNVTLDGITVSDPRTTSPVCPVRRLPPGGRTSCTATYSVQQADLDAGHIVNQAAATAKPPSGPDVSTTSNQHSISGQPRPELRLVKKTSAASYDSVDDTIDYSFEVINTGNQTISDVHIDDPLLGGVVCGSFTLSPGQAEACDGTYEVTAEALDAGRITNRATAAGTSPDGADVSTASNEVEVPGVYRPELTMVKSTTATEFEAAGTEIPFRFTVINTGNVTIDQLAITDDKIGDVTCQDTTLPLGEQTTCEGTYTVTQADVDAGQIVNQATAVGEVPPGGPPLPPVESNEVTVTGVQQPGLSIVKSADVTEVTGTDQPIRYEFVIVNTGNTTIENIAVDDPQVGEVSCPATVIAPEASLQCSASYTVTAADLEAGRVVNIAGVTGNVPGQPPLPPVSSNQVETVVRPAPTPAPRPADDVEVQGAVVTNPDTVTPAPTPDADAQLPRTGRGLRSMVAMALGLGIAGRVLAAARRRGAGS